MKRYGQKSENQDRLLVIDECIEGKYNKILREDGWLHYDVCRMNPGITDDEVIEIAEKYNGIIFTHDRDFLDCDIAYVWRGRDNRSFKRNYRRLEKMLWD